MKPRLVEYLCCPVCRAKVALESFAGDGEIDEGILTCAGCARTYPVINGIPRMLPDELASQAFAFHIDFFQRHAARLTSYLGRCHKPSVSTDEWWAAEQRTVRSYSYQWRKFKEMFPHWEQLFQESIRPLEPAFFKGKIGLDAGCGYGRSLYYSASYGADVIGLDLSEAIEAARANTGHLPGAHFVQGDIFHPPVHEGTLDFVYSIGVLQHLPNPRKGFEALSRLLKPGAPIGIWVYKRGKGRQIAAFTAMRAISTQLPLPLLDVICFGLAAVQWAVWIAPYKLLNRWRATRWLAQLVPFTLYARYPFRVLHADWVDGLSVPLVDYYRPEEIAEWYRGAKLERIRIDQDWGGRALGYAAEELHAP